MPGPIAISLGDPAGIGPEIVARALAARPDADVVVYGDAGGLARAAGGGGGGGPRRGTGARAAAGVAAPTSERVRAVTALAAGEITPGKPSDASGRAQLAYLAAAT